MNNYITESILLFQSCVHKLIIWTNSLNKINCDSCNINLNGCPKPDKESISLYNSFSKWKCVLDYVNLFNFRIIVAWQLKWLWKNVFPSFAFNRWIMSCWVFFFFLIILGKLELPGHNTKLYIYLKENPYRKWHFQRFTKVRELSSVCRACTFEGYRND
jgi:hypothetical protein